MAAVRLLSRVRLLTVALCLYPAAGLPARAQEKADKATFEVDTKDSRIFVKVDKSTRLGHLHGIEGNLKSGKLTFGGTGELVFDMASLTADTEEARKRVGLADKPGPTENQINDVTKTMRSEQVLDVAQYPTATFRATAIKPLDKQAPGESGMYQLEGSFSLHGAERKIEFKAKAERGEKEGTLRLTGVFQIKQTEYGIKPVTAAGGFAKVADVLDVHGDLRLRPAAGK
jgi:polyisoprenoid-binding protein YceI